MKRCAIIGSRNWTDYDSFRREVFAAFPGADVAEIGEIVSGGARGVDAMARRLADELGVALIEYPPTPHSPGTRAYALACKRRNQQIADRLRVAYDEAIAFPGPDSKGTWDCVRRIKARGIEPNIINAPQ